MPVRCVVRCSFICVLAAVSSEMLRCQGCDSWEIAN
jgi:hypothetical protein